MHEFSPFRYYESYTFPILKIIGSSLVWIAWTVFSAFDYFNIDPSITHSTWFGVIVVIGIGVAYILMPIQICSSIAEILFAKDNIIESQRQLVNKGCEASLYTPQNNDSTIDTDD